MNHEVWQRHRVDDVFDLIHLIYDTTLDATRWETVVSKLTALFDSGCASMVVTDPAGDEWAVKAGYALAPDTVASIRDRVREALFPGGTETFAFVGDLTKRCGTEDKPARRRRGGEPAPAPGPDHCLGMAIQFDSGRIGVVGLSRPAAAVPFTADDHQRLASLAPHFRAALRMGSQYGQVSRQRNAAFAALEQMGDALAILEEDGRIHYHNRAMRDLATEGDIRIVQGRFHVESNPIRHRIDAALRDCVAAIRGNHPYRSRVIAIPRSDHRRPLAVLLVPLDSCGPLVSSTPLTMLMASTPDTSMVIHREPLEELYGMTAAEADVAAMLAEGRSPDEITRILGVSMNTVRTHMKRAFEKTCVGRQADLVRVLLNTSRCALGGESG